MHHAALARLALIAGLLAPGVTAFAQTALPKDSPFLPPAGITVASAGAAETLELAGISGTGKKILVCIVDTQTKRSHWIAVDATVEGIKVVAFDARQEQATVLFGGQQKVLRMRRTSVAAGTNAAGTAAASFTTPFAPIPVTQGVPQPPPAPGSVAQQETEARMLVSDLLEIGIQQRKAYEEAQKKADQDKTAGKSGGIAPTTPPTR